MNGQESPNMDKAQEMVTFFAMSLNYTLHLKAEKKGFDGEVPFIIPARLIKFGEGSYSTDDKEEIELIRKCKSYRNGKVTEEKKKEVLDDQKTHRGAITSATIKKEAGVEGKPPAMTIQEQGVRVCDVPGCDYAVKDDFSGNKLRMHKLGKHRIGMRPKVKIDNGGDIKLSLATKKKDVSLAEAKKGAKELKIKQ